MTLTARFVTRLRHSPSPASVTVGWIGVGEQVRVTRTRGDWAAFGNLGWFRLRKNRVEAFREEGR